MGLVEEDRRIATLKLKVVVKYTTNICGHNITPSGSGYKIEMQACTYTYPDEAIVEEEADEASGDAAVGVHRLPHGGPHDLFRLVARLIVVADGEHRRRRDQTRRRRQPVGIPVARFARV
jgi:hypothetical protein